MRLRLRLGLLQDGDVQFERVILEHVEDRVAHGLRISGRMELVADGQAVVRSSYRRSAMSFRSFRIASSDSIIIVPTAK